MPFVVDLLLIERQSNGNSKRDAYGSAVQRGLDQTMLPNPPPAYYDRGPRAGGNLLFVVDLVAPKFSALSNGPRCSRSGSFRLQLLPHDLREDKSGPSVWVLPINNHT